MRNLWGYSPEKVFRAPADFSPHDLDTDYDFHDFNAAVLDDPVYSAALSKRGSRRSRTLSWDRTAANLLHALRATAELD